MTQSQKLLPPASYYSNMGKRKFFVIVSDKTMPDRLLSKHGAFEISARNNSRAPIPLNSTSSVMGSVFDLNGSEIVVIQENNSGYADNANWKRAKDIMDTARSHSVSAVFRQSYARTIHPDSQTGILGICTDILNPIVLFPSISSSSSLSSNFPTNANLANFPFSISLIDRLACAAEANQLQFQLNEVYLTLNQRFETAAMIQELLNSFSLSRKHINGSSNKSHQPILGLDGAVEIVHAEVHRIPYAVIAIPKIRVTLDEHGIGLTKKTKVLRTGQTELSKDELRKSHDEFCDLIVATIKEFK